SRDLGAAEHGDEWMPGVAQQLAEVLQLLFHEKAGDRRLEHVRDRFRGRVGAMGRAERIVHIEIAQGGERFGELGIVFLFPRPEARVLDERDAAARQAPRGWDAYRRIGNELDGRPE